MWWKIGTPKKGEFVGVINAKKYLVRFHNGTYRVLLWLGDRWNIDVCVGNPITHNCLITSPNNVN